MQLNKELNDLYLSRLKQKRKEFDKQYELNAVPKPNHPNFYKVVSKDDINNVQAKDLAFYLTLSANEQKMYTYFLVQQSLEAYKKYSQLTTALNNAGISYLSAIISVEQYLDQIEARMEDLYYNHDMSFDRECVDIESDLSIMQIKLKYFENEMPKMIWREVNQPSNEHTSEKYEIIDILSDIRKQSNKLMNATIRLDNISALNNEFFIQNRIWSEKLITAQKVEPELSKFLRKPKKRVGACFKRINKIEYELKALENDRTVNFQR